MIGFLGVGKMGEAILASLLKGGVAKAADIVACDAVPDRLRLVRRRYRVATAALPEEVAAKCDIVFLAVKPQQLDPLLAALAPALTRRHLLISIAAGKTLSRLQTLAGGKARLVRVMPNLPVMAGAGMSAFCLGVRATPRDRRAVARLLACSGEVIELEERHFDAVTALSGSGPAFFTRVMVGLADAAVRLGLPREASRRLALQTMFGTARYLLETGQDPEVFVKSVTSPQGTTAAGLAIMDSSSLRAILTGTIAAAARRSRALNKVR
ncbi:MAG: pyrroline-5-carboxylate reductase [Kiritimatiellae bacterium]|nr:pyrroline-5-carboxylate reductase [Kiritimatiellia bacterium]